jgi:queuine tRNA-ribosyltransferase subunit QTRTD1
VDSYIESAKILGPDIFIGPADVVYADKCSEKRREKTVDRTVEWTERLITVLSSTPGDTKAPKPSVFAPILPLPALEQRMYTAELADQHLQYISGLALYDPFIFPDLPSNLRCLTALSLSPPAIPHDVLSQVSKGIDLMLPSFTSSASDSGLALTFSFPAPSQQATEQQPLAVDLSPSDVHSTSTIPLQEHCECYACHTHTRAYVNHLLAAREMMAWNLLQIHNHHVTSKFFSGIRGSIKAGSFEADCEAFEKYYVKDLPTSVLGIGPRVRGYEMKSGRGQARPNPKAFDSKLKSQPLGTLPNAEGSETAEDMGRVELQEHGMGVEKQE